MVAEQGLREQGLRLTASQNSGQLDGTRRDVPGKAPSDGLLPVQNEPRRALPSAVASAGYRRRFRWAWVVLAIAALSGVARADDGREQALTHFRVGHKHYNLGEFAEALREFKEAYRLKDDPAFLFNLGQCQWKLHDDEGALHSYRAYLRLKKDAPNRTEVEARVLDLERRTAGRAAPPVLSPTSAPSSDAQRPSATVGVTPPGGAPSSAMSDEPRTARQPPPAAGPLSPGLGSSDHAAAPGTGSVAAPDAARALPPAPTPAVQTPAPSTPVRAIAEANPPADQPALTSAPAFYMRWWFWSAAATALGGAILGGVALYTRDDQVVRGSAPPGVVDLR